MPVKPLLSKAMLRDRGWTEAAIARWLGAPDGYKKSSYPGGAPVCLFARARVEAVEGTDAFKSWLVERRARGERGKAAAARRVAALVSRLAVWDPGLPSMALDDARRRAIASYNDRQMDRVARGHEDVRFADEDSAQAFLDRITVNWLRHRATRYDALLAEVAGQVGVREAEAMIRTRVFEAIAEQYPELAKEARRQLAARLGEAPARGRTLRVTRDDLR